MNAVIEGGYLVSKAGIEIALRIGIFQRSTKKINGESTGGEIKHSRQVSG